MRYPFCYRAVLPCCVSHGADQPQPARKSSARGLQVAASQSAVLARGGAQPGRQQRLEAAVATGCPGLCSLLSGTGGKRQEEGRCSLSIWQTSPVSGRYL